MANLTGKAALVTGASRGIGRAIAQRLAEDGALVAVHYGHNTTAADETVAAIEQAGGQAFCVQAVFGTERDMDALFAGLDKGLRDHNADGLDVLVNNAAEAEFGTLTDLTSDSTSHLFAVNTLAPLFIVQRALPLLRDGGRIVNISSAITRHPLPVGVAYAMTKAAIEALTKALALIAGPRDITVNAVAPGPVDTGLAPFPQQARLRAHIAAGTALGRIGEPDDIADVVAFLASGDARWVTGQLIEASGGLWGVPPPEPSGL